MAKADRLDPDSSHWAWLAVDLRVWRLERNMSQRDVADACGVTVPTVSNWESGSAKPSQRHAETLDRLWRTRGHFARLRQLAESSHDPDWFAEYTRYEARATTIKHYSLAIIPGLLQTFDYAKALLEGGEVVEDVKGGAETRIGRQTILKRQQPPHMEILISQSALDWPVGGPDVMREQLARLLEASRSRGIFVRVIARSAGAHVGLDGSFSIMRSESFHIAYMEANGGGRLLQDPVKLADYEGRFARIGADALSRAASRSLIAEVMEAVQ